MSPSEPTPIGEHEGHPLVAILSRVPYLEGLSPVVLAALAETAARRRLDAGNIVFWEGDPSAGLYVVESGIVKIMRMSRDGREQIVHMIQAGDTFNDVAALDGGANPATTIAHTDAVVWCIRRDDLQRTVDRHPPLAWALMASMARRTRHLVALVEDLALHSVKGRLARLLLEQAQNNESQAVPRLLTQEEMASRLGTVREMVGRSLRSLAADGILKFDRHRIVILDTKRLNEEAEK